MSDPHALARAMEELPHGVLVHRGPGHLVVGANRAARTFLGDRPGILGRPLAEVFPEIAGQNLLGHFDRVYATGEPFTAREWRIEVTGDGDDRFVDVDAVALHDPPGEVSGVAVQFRDATATVRHRRSLEADTADLRERYAAAQDVVLTLQRSLLPDGLPVLPGMRIAAHYLVAGAEQAAGGDWFEAVALDGTAAIMVGDVVGHGSAAAAVMAQLRAVLVEFLLDGDDLDTVLARLDAFAGRVPGARGATVCIALVTPDGEVRYVCAGHPPPLVVSIDGAARYLPAPGGGPLGVAGPAATVGTAVLAAGDLVLCYSDGLVERPSQDLTVGLTELAEVASAAMRRGPSSTMSADATDRVAELTVERMTRHGYHDDVTVLALRLTGRAVPDFVTEIPAEPARLSTLRRDLETWLTELGVSDADIASIEIAAVEAATNSVEHAYPGGGGSVRVEGQLDGQGRVCMTITDGGRWRPAPPDPGHRGRGLMMMRGCMDTVEIDDSPEGTVLLLDRRVRREPVVSPATVVETSAVPRPSTMSVTRTVAPEPRIALGGPIDLSTAEDLRRELWSASRGGALPLVVELGAVTHLGSAGIQVLYDFVEDMAADGRALRFVVPPGSPARHAIVLSDLDRIVAVGEV
ncbi:sigma-F factor regulator [Pseudonocardia petroleophila]|uniref:SpoIIE family protein phosphatase n=1 Tax=Pseudonocardia petroleophila TaxID=37331 RepID=A0A7G7ME63_9PSEU|nr:SpoIIE family protein phosphatase [Pseudonocardia petroleophila]QNG51074.1 SpoIIE family protein phosphatase [Pseudonocardia petroleophila]